MSQDATPAAPVRAALWAVGLLILAAAIWHVSGVVFVIFAGLMIAAILHFAALAIADRTGMARNVALGILFAVIAILILGAVTAGGVGIWTQFNEMASAIDDQVAELNGMLKELGYSAGIGNAGGLIPGTDEVSSSIKSIAGTIVSGFGNIFVILFIGAFIAWEPSVYRKGFVSLFPKARRTRIGEVADEAAQHVARWALGQAVAMVVVFFASWILLWLIGMPYAFLLALQAGLLAFIPTIGPILAGIPMVLVGLSEGGSMALWGAGAYAAVQLIESNLLTPLVQRKVTSLSPALMLGTQLVFGALFGLGGLMMAVPVLAAATTVIGRLYVEDWLGGWAGEPDDAT